jgi:regulator of protease activity HflC (stomatin/prohibitin superfamily)
MNLKKLSTGLISFGSAMTGALVLSKAIYTVEPGERAIIFNKIGGQGVSKEVKGEGFHLYIPFVQEIIKYDVKIQPYDYFSFTGTKDMQKVEIKIKIFFR